MERVTDLELVLDRASAVPLYHQVAGELERAIADGRLSEGEFLENELQLASDWGLSRLTVRRAIQELVDKGLLVRRRRVGTQVINDQVARPAGLGSLYDDLVKRGQVPTTTVLAHDRVIADDVIAEQLGLPPDTAVVYLERCRYADGRRLAIMRNWLTVAAAGDLTTEELASAGLYELLRARGIWPHSSRRRIIARVASPIDAALLGLPVGAPLLVSEATMQARSGVRVEVSEHVHDGAAYAMELAVVAS